MACLTCRHWKQDVRPEYQNYGHCHRYPPQLVWVTHFDVSNGDWGQDRPYMAHDDYCGEFAERPTTKEPDHGE